MIDAYVQLCAAAGSGGDKLRTQSWIEVRLVDETNQPVAGETYALQLPGGAVIEGTLDEQGSVRIDALPPGICQVSFPNLDKDAWTAVQTQPSSAAPAASQDRAA